MYARRNAQMDIKMRIEDYPYLYETHMHTSESSACARSTGREMAQAAKEAGYTGIIITDHNWYGNSCISAGLPWEEWIEQFCTGYEHAKDKGEEIWSQWEGISERHSGLGR